MAVTEELKITCAVEGKLGKQRVKNKSDDVSKGKHKVKGYQVEDLEDGECTEPASNGSSGSQQLNPSQARRKTLNNTRKGGKFLNNTQKSGEGLKHLHSGRKGKDKFTNKTEPEERMSLSETLKKFGGKGKRKDDKITLKKFHTDSGNAETFNCKFCGKSFPSKGSLNFHMTSEQCL